MKAKIKNITPRSRAKCGAALYFGGTRWHPAVEVRQKFSLCRAEQSRREGQGSIETYPRARAAAGVGRCSIARMPMAISRRRAWMRGDESNIVITRFGGRHAMKINLIGCYRSATPCPKIRRHVTRHILAPGLGREKILATIVRVMDLSAIRVGNEEYAHDNHSYGLTTLQHRHVQIHGTTIEFKFRGKSGQFHDISIEDARLSKIVKNCQHLPGQELFEWVDETGKVHTITSGHVNNYLFEITGQEFTARFSHVDRHFVCRACVMSRRQKRHESVHQRSDQLVSVKLGNTPAVCKKSYVHPEIVECYRNGKLARLFEKLPKTIPGLRSEETAVLVLLHEHHETINGKNLGKQLKASLKKVRAAK